MTETFIDMENKDGDCIFYCLPGTAAATAGNYGVIFIANNPIEIISISEAHTVIGNDAGAVTLNLERLSGTDALDAGDEICITSFNLKNTANTVVKKRSGRELKNRQLEIGDRLALKDAGTLTNVGGVCVSIYYKRLGKGHYQ